MKRRLLTLVALFALAWAPAAWADNTTCANAEPLIVGSQDVDFLAASGSIFFKTALTAGRSYIFWVYPPDNDASEGTTAVSLALFTNSSCTIAAATTDTGEREPLDNITGADVDQISIKPTASGTYWLQISNGVANAYNVETTVIETSIFSPWWFVGGTNQAFVTLRNNMDTTTSVTLTLFHNNGTVCGSEIISIGGNDNLFRVVNDFPTCVTAAFGSAMITYFGPPGGIAANTTVIDAVQGVSFDEPFTPRMVWTITER
jgi:hypothetical protein